MNELEKQELMHTCYLMSDMFDTYVLESNSLLSLPLTDKNQRILKHISAISGDLGRLYQRVANIKTIDGGKDEPDIES